MPFILFPILYVLWKLKTGVQIVKVADMDFVTDIAEIEADT
jgi:amino acid transporter